MSLFACDHFDCVGLVIDLKNAMITTVCNVDMLSIGRYRDPSRRPELGVLWIAEIESVAYSLTACKRSNRVGFVVDVVCGGSHLRIDVRRDADDGRLRMALPAAQFIEARPESVRNVFVLD